MQTMARKNEWPLDKMCLTVDVTKKTKEDYGHPPREGAYLHGLHMEGKTPQGIQAGLFNQGPFLLRLKLVFVLCLLFLGIQSLTLAVTYLFPDFCKLKCQDVCST